MLAAADAVRVSGVLGRSRPLIALFDYLVSRSADGRPPKESEIAYEVFGKSGQFETGQDAVVRVYVRRLRRKLEAHAPDADRAAGFHLSLPKGEYRIIGEAAPMAASPPRAPRRLDRRWAAAGVAAFLVLAALNAGAWLLLTRQGGGAAEAGRSPAWAPLAQSRLPLLLVVGDYYILGDSDDGIEVSRMVREYQVNSAEDLNLFLMDHPEKTARYMDIGLSYLPTSSAAAMARIAPLFAGRKPSRVVMASALTPELLKANGVIYIGYLSGLGPLRDAAFSGSRFEIGEGFDEIRDTADGRRYLSQAGLGPSRGGVYRDYGYASIFPGPAGNQIAIIAGSRDIGAMAIAEQMTDPQSLRALAKAVDVGAPFEALYEVKGQGEVNFRSRLVHAVSRKPPSDRSAGGD